MLSDFGLNVFFKATVVATGLELKGFFIARKIVEREDFTYLILCKSQPSLKIVAFLGQVLHLGKERLEAGCEPGYEVVVVNITFAIHDIRRSVPMNTKLSGDIFNESLYIWAV